MKLLNFTSALLAFVVLTLFSVGAQATVVNTLLRVTTPPNTDILCRSSISSSTSLVQNCWTALNAPGNGNPGTKKILEYFDLIVPGFDSRDELYKADYDDGNGKEVGPLASSYSTAFDNSSGDVLHATITHTGGSSADCSNLTSPCFVLIKGGHSPYAYLFNLALGWDSDTTVMDGYGWSSNAIRTPSWNGTMGLDLRNFEDNQLGSISHVALYGNISAVPVPAAFWLFGSALAGLGWLRRKQTV